MEGLHGGRQLGAELIRRVQALASAAGRHTAHTVVTGNVHEAAGEWAAATAALNALWQPP